MKRLLSIAIVAMAMIGNAAAGRADDHPIIAMVKAKVKDTSKPFNLVVTAKVKDGKAAQFEASFAEAIKFTKTEKGNITYQLNRDSDDANKYLVYERWKNVDALAEHLKSETISKLLAALPDVLDGAPDFKIMIAVGE